MDSKNIQKWSTFYENNIDAINKSIDDLVSKKPIYIIRLSSLAWKYQFQGFLQMLLHQDSTKAKQSLYIGALLGINHQEGFGPHYDEPPNSALGDTPLSMALYSDNRDLVLRAANCTSAREESMCAETRSGDAQLFLIGKCAKAIVRGDLAVAQASYQQLALKVHSTKNISEFAVDLVYLRALIDGDAGAIEASLIAMLDPKALKKRNRLAYVATDDFLAFPVAWYLKLAWFMGHEIEINHPKIPMELIRVHPLSDEAYVNPYSFLK